MFLAFNNNKNRNQNKIKSKTFKKIHLIIQIQNKKYFEPFRSQSNEANFYRFSTDPYRSEH